MLKTLALGAVSVGVFLAMRIGLAGVPSSAEEAGTGYAASVASESEFVEVPSVAPATLTEVVHQYCVSCHNDQLLTGQVSLQSFDVDRAAEQAETAERMIRKLRAGMMPPPGMPRPSPDTLLALVETLEAKVDEVARTTPNLGERRFQRLSREEYERSVSDLLSLQIDASEWLPPDVFVGSFDNASAAQVLSSTLLAAFLRAAGEVSRLAVGDPAVVSSTTRHANPAVVSQHPWDRIEGAPLGTRGGMVVTHDFPADGDYVFEVGRRWGRGSETPMEDIDLSIDGEPAALLMLEHNGGNILSTVRTEPIFVRAGPHSVSATFVRRIDGPYEDRFSPAKWSAVHSGSSGAESAGQYGITGLPHLTELLITGPENVTGVSETVSRQKVFTCRPMSPGEERPCAQAIFARLASQAYRRPLKDGDVADLMMFYDSEIAQGGGFEVGVEAGLQAILASPEFLFRLEREPENVRAGEKYRLGDVDLATRLAYFLWASPPDAELLELAERGRLSDAAVLEQQVDRMLGDPRSETLATRFAHQWLRLQHVARVWPETYFYPDFSAQLASSLVRETEMLFENLVKKDRGILELFGADYTFLNERLAQHYGIEGVSGEEMRLVRYPNDQRRGVLSHGSILQLTSMSDRTSPVLRGKWVMEVLMGTPPPPPPPNVPAFEASPPAAGATVELLQKLGAPLKCLNTHFRNQGNYCPSSGVPPFEGQVNGQEPTFE